MPLWNKINFQNSNSPLMEHLYFFHDHSMTLIFSITTLVVFTMLMSKMNHLFNVNMLESQSSELFWTSIPALMLMFIAIPSMKTLYMMEENMKTFLTIKTTGFQWYWNYEYPKSKMKTQMSCSLLNLKSMRVMTTNMSVHIPTFTPTRMLISSSDVLHSWTIPSMGVKSDATPGRMNQLLMLVKRPGIMMGQCSEICGAGHSMMPIFMENPMLKK